ncbi:hypothetical protein SCLCIDRAFT_132575, partial [Scleroderma citrinum Foug A]
SELQASLAMSSRENRAFGLDYSLHTRFLQVKTNSIGRERLVNDIFKGFGDLNCIFSLVRGDKMLRMVNIDRRKLGRTSSNGLRKGRMLPRAKCGYSRGADTNLLGNSFIRMARVKQRENGVLLSKRGI